MLACCAVSGWERSKDNREVGDLIRGVTGEQNS